MVKPAIAAGASVEKGETSFYQRRKAFRELPEMNANESSAFEGAEAFFLAVVTA